jgi:hypothetical protein
MLATVRPALAKLAAASGRQPHCSAVALLQARQAKQGLPRASLQEQAASSSSSNSVLGQLEVRVLVSSRGRQQQQQQQQAVQWAGLQQLLAVDTQAKQGLATAALSRQLLARLVAVRIGIVVEGC